jgi:hypothetical protein
MQTPHQQARLTPVMHLLQVAPVTTAHILKLAKVRSLHASGGTLEHVEGITSDTRVWRMQMGAYNTIPFFRVDKVRTRLRQNWSQCMILKPSRNSD